MLGLSSSYYGFQGKGLYKSVSRVFELGFETVELGAGHSWEPKIEETLRKIKRDFPNKSYTLHGLFPPLEERHWFNASLGLTELNQSVVEGFFKAAELMEAKVVSIHPGFNRHVSFGKDKSGLVEPEKGETIPQEEAWEGMFSVLQECLKKAEEVGCDFAIENITERGHAFIDSKEKFEKIFQAFPGLKFLFDIGHAMWVEKTEQYIEAFWPKIGQIHMHFSRPKSQAQMSDEHKPITSLGQIKALEQVKQFREIPVIFEHGPNIVEKEILGEKKLLEEFEESFK